MGSSEVHRVDPSLLRDFNSLTAEIQDQLMRADSEEAVRIIKNLRSIAEGQFVAQHDRITLPPQMLNFNSEYFVSPTNQFVNVLEWNERFFWKIPESVFSAFNHDPPKWPSKKLSAVVLVVYLETVQGTYQSLWEVIARNMREKNIHAYRNDKGLPSLLPGARHPGVCLRWETIDFSPRHIGAKPVNVRSAEESPHAAIMSAAAHFPNWLVAMDGSEVPFVWLHGYTANLGENEPWPKRVPLLGWDKDHVELSLELCAENRDIGQTAFPWRMD
ncbi:MAG: hypothetical protein NTW66_00635 [Candidatus Magasanikbacteria bacterium]|nr:hypothetical protein [Candidatus Magasanikbacteria bacterium]